MEDYSVGNVSDLVTGTKTPNKKKGKKATPKKSPGQANKPKPTPQKAQPIKQEIKEESDSEDEEIVASPPPIVGKKRKSSTSDTSEPAEKLSKNAKNAERRITKKEKREQDPTVLARTLFVGNLPITVNTVHLKKFFAKFGAVESVRIRGVPVADPKMSKKVAFIKKEFNPKRKSLYGFVLFKEEEDAQKALELNGTVYKDHHLRVHLCSVKVKPEENLAIFIGNLSFAAEEDELWKIFEPCGAISSVRIVRNGKTGMGKGFGYVNFQSADSVTLALEMENVTLNNRELRIKTCDKNAPKKALVPKQKQIKPRPNKKTGKIIKQEDGKPIVKTEGKKNFNKTFQGVKLTPKKKGKFNKGALQKHKKGQQIVPKVEKD